MTSTNLEAGFHFRGKLPHLKREGATYFVTFRLADSLPKSVLSRLKAERDAIRDNAFAQKRPLTWHEEEGLRARVDRLLARIQREGLDSLTDEERAFLRRASKRFRG